jgi:hypothetical protein
MYRVLDFTGGDQPIWNRRLFVHHEACHYKACPCYHHRYQQEEKERRTHCLSHRERGHIRRIPENYSRERYSYVAYYRDYQTRRDEYINLNEAIVEVRDGGFGSDDQLQTNISLLQYRSNTDFPRDSIAEAPYDNNPMAFYKDRNKFIPNAILSPMGGNELGILRLHDAIRNYNIRTYSYVDIFKTNFVEHHSFKMEEAVYLDSVTLYCISFESNYSASGPRNFAKGKIYIDVKDMAIHKLEYACFNKTMKEVQLMFEINVEYARSGRFMYLNYISFNNYFKTHNEREFRVIDIIYDRQRNAVLLKFNSEPESVSVLNEQNYQVMLRNQSIPVIRVERSPGVKTDVFVYLDESVRGHLETVLRTSPSDLQFDIQNVRDIGNRELDKVTNTTLYQFRELFVQQLIPHPADAPRSASVDPNKPLGANPTVRVSDEYARYWMNTPLRKKEER